MVESMKSSQMKQSGKNAQISIVLKTHFKIFNNLVAQNIIVEKYIRY